MSAPRQAPALPALVTRGRRGARPADLASVRALADPARVRRILVVKLHDQLGDFLVAVPALAALRAHYPAARLDLLTRDYLAPLAARVPAIDRAYVLPRAFGPGAPGTGPRALWGACVPRPDLVFVFNSVSRSRSADLVAALSGGRVVVGRSVVGAGPLPVNAPRAALDGARVGTDAVYDLDLPVAAGSEHQVDRLLDLVRWTGADTSAAPGLALTSADRAQAAAAFERAGVRGEGRMIGLHPAAANPLKCWPGEAFAALGDRLAVETGAALVVFDTPKEPGPAGALVAALVARGRRATLVPALPLGAFAGACARLDLLACNDSGVMHVAAAVDTRVLSFHSLGRPAEWAPRGVRARALHHEPIAGIGTDEAARAAHALLEVP